MLKCAQFRCLPAEVRFLLAFADMATGVATVQPMSGEALHLRKGALASQEVFQREVRCREPTFVCTLNPNSVSR